MFVIGEYRGHGKTALLSRLGPLEVSGTQQYEVKIVTKRRFKNIEAAKQYARDHGISFDKDDRKTRST